MTYDKKLTLFDCGENGQKIATTAFLVIVVFLEKI